VKTIKLWQKMGGWLITPFFIVFFYLILLGFHLPIVVANLFGKRPAKHALDYMNLSITTLIRTVGCASVRLIPPNPPLPTDRSILLVANHQSMYDIPMMMWMLRSREVGFISKRELARGIPSISYSLRNLDSVLIDRKEPRQAIPAIEAFGRLKEERKQIACIFPEGTRARDGQMKPFKGSGFDTLLNSMPSALIQPVVIDGNWELLRYKLLPVPIGVKITVKFLEPVEPRDLPADARLASIEAVIRKGLQELRDS